MTEIDYSKVGKLPPYPGSTSTSGRWIASPTGNISALATTLNRLYVDEIYIPEPVQLNQLAFQVTTAGLAGSVAKLGIYSDIDEMPGNLIAEATGTADCTTTGVKTLPITTGILVPGSYWLGAVIQGAVCSVWGSSKNPNQSWSTTAAGALGFQDVGYVQDNISNSLPATFVSLGSVDVVLRVAAQIQ